MQCDYLEHHGCSCAGVELIEKALDDGWLQVARLSSKEKSTAHRIVSKGGLVAGEAESLALASFRKLIVILDDRAPGHLLRSWGSRSLELQEYCSTHL